MATTTRGTYFITLCTKPRLELFGKITGQGAGARIELSEVGRIVEQCWNALPAHFPSLKQECMQIMPDHLHAIVSLSGVGSTRRVDGTAGSRASGPAPGSLGAIIGAFKYESTKLIVQQCALSIRQVWLEGYHERIVRRQPGEYERIEQYIAENPAHWRSGDPPTPSA
ncbi:MAG TPA: transposase [Flavobacteriales bacterium]|nr:transposase [Flavobacteriales bacterium]